MIFVVDIGNTNTTLGLFAQEKLCYHWRIATKRNATADEIAMTLMQLFRYENVSPQHITKTMVASVVPPLHAQWDDMCQKYFSQKPQFVDASTHTGLVFAYDNPQEVGADRIVNAVAGIQQYGAPLLIVDFGTATTVCYINASAQYVGGVIAPGVAISTEALYMRAAKLPRIELAKPKRLIGNSTIEAMQAGILYGFAGQVDGIVQRIWRAYDTTAPVVATGGLATLLAPETQTITHVEPHLTLIGLAAIARSQQTSPS